MGLLKAGAGALGGVLADQWREYFYCESMDADVLAVKGAKRISQKRSSNTKAEDNIITNGSIIAVNDGQCMMIVEQGKVVEFCAEPGEFVYDTSTEPSIFYGGLGEGIKKSFATMGKRFTFGGDTAKDQRVYYFNTKEILGNKFGTATPVPFRLVDRNIGLDMDITVRCHGEYSYKISDPVVFYTNVCGNVSEAYTRDNLDSQLKSEILAALQPAFSKISALGIRYSELPGHTPELSDAMNEVLNERWTARRGLAIVSAAIASVSTTEETENMLREVQRNAVFRNADMAAAHLVGAQAQAMQDAAKNEGGMGAIGGIFGMNAVQNAGGQIDALYQQAERRKQNAAPASAPAAEGGWTCSCGKSGNTGKFCTECGKEKPADKGTWTCSCGKSGNTGKFCSECGKQRPEEKTYRCNKCGWTPEDPKNPPKFCPECGDPFNDEDAK